MSFNLSKYQPQKYITHVTDFIARVCYKGNQEETGVDMAAQSP